MRSNEQLQLDVVDELAWDPAVDGSGITIVAQDGVVTMAGRVGTYAEKWEAERAVKRVRGVMAIANEIEVRPPSSLVRSDTSIAQVAIDALKRNVTLPGEKVKVTVSNGWVTLDGMLDWQYQKRLAEQSIRHLAGVKGVNNFIKLRIGPTVPVVRDKLTLAFRRNAELDAEHVRVEADGGIVTLRGSVRSLHEKELAEATAWGCGGVTDVHNWIVVEEPALVL